jgi:tetratricopeptide (TPR) repeat protein
MNKTDTNNLYLHSIAISIIVALTITTYLNCLPNQFVYDDTSIITENRLIKDWESFRTLFTPDYFKYSGELTYRPLVTLSYFIDYSLWHTNPMGYHVVNVVLHTTNVTLLYFFVLLLFRQNDACKTQHSRTQPPPPLSPAPQGEKKEMRHQRTFQSIPSQGDTKEETEITKKLQSRICLSFLTCALFAVHPIVSEVVNVISYREDLITTAFLITSFLFFLLYREREIPQIPLNVNSGKFLVAKPFRKDIIFFYAAAITTYFLALLSKESAIALPALIFFFDLLFSARAWTTGRSALFLSLCKAVSKITRSPLLLGYAGISVIYLVIRFFILHNPEEKIAYPEGSFLVNMITGTKVLGRYIANIFLPLNLNADYHVLYLKTPITLSFIMPVFTLISVATIAIRLRTKATAQPFHSLRGSTFKLGDKQLFAILWFFICVLPVLNIIPLANIMADRYLYLPLIGFCLFLSTVLTPLRRKIKYPVIVSLISFYLITTITRNNTWRDEFTLWHNSSQSPFCSFTTYNNLGTQYNKKGNPDAALQCYHKALQKAQEVGFTQYATVHYNIGNAYEKKNLPDMAISAYKKAIQIKPDYQQAHNNLGKIYFTLGQYEVAIYEYNAAIMIDPTFAYAYNNLGVLYNKLGKQEDAIESYKKALSSDPHYGDAYYNLGNIYEARKQDDLALETYQAALKADPTHVYVHNNLGTIYDKKGLLEDAIGEYKHATRLDPTYPYSYNNLGASLTKKGDMDDALTAFQKAVDLLPNQPDFHFNIGYTYLQKGPMDNAQKEFETTLKLAPSHSEALFCMGTIYYRQGYKEKAMKSWQAVLALNPNHTKAKKCLKMLAE